MKTDSNTAYSIRLSAIYVGWFSVIGVQMPFWPVWLENRGLGSSDIGLVLMLGLLIKVASAPFLAQIADRYGVRRNLIIVLAVASLASHALFAWADGFVAIMLVTALSSLFYPAIIPMADNLALLIARDRGLHYGRMRLWGSISFVAVSMAGGVIVDATTEAMVLWLVLGGLVLLIIVASLAPKEKGAAAKGSHGYGMTARFATLFKDKRFVVVLIAAGMVQAGHGVYYTFGTIYWRQAGLADDVIGLLWALGVGAEIVLFAVIGGVGSRISSAKLMMVAAIAGIVRWTLMPMVDGIVPIVLLQCLHGFTFGACHLAAIQYIARHIPIELSATAQSLYSSLSMGLLLAGSTVMSGYLSESMGAASYWVMALFCLAGLVLAIVFERLGREEALAQ